MTMENFRVRVISFCPGDVTNLGILTLASFFYFQFVLSRCHT